MSTLHDLLAYHKGRAFRSMCDSTITIAERQRLAAQHSRFAAAIEGLDVVKSVTTIKVQPGETVLVTTGEALEPDACSQLVDIMREAFPGGRVVILDASLDVSKVC